MDASCFVVSLLVLGKLKSVISCVSTDVSSVAITSGLDELDVFEPPPSEVVLVIEGWFLSVVDPIVTDVVCDVSL